MESWQNVIKVLIVYDVELSIICKRYNYLPFF